MDNEKESKELFKSGEQPAEADFTKLIDETALQIVVSNLVKQLEIAVNNASKAEQETVQAAIGISGTVYQSLKKRLDAEYDSVVMRLADITTQPLKYSGIGTGMETPISQAFPSVTLSEVQTLDSTATLSDTADWYVLQKLIQTATSNRSKRLNFPQGTFRISKPINLVRKLGTGWIIEGTGCILKASNGYTGSILILDRGNDYSQSRNGKITGLALDGNYTASIGFQIDDAHEWFLENIRVYNCFVGIQLTDTYYGEVSGECVIQNCLTGIKTVAGKATEVNTIDFNNIKVNFATSKTNFIPENIGETDADYNIRVISIGIELNTMIMGCKFRGLTLEGMDYGFYGTKIGAVGVSKVSIFRILDCYFEAIKMEAIRLVSYPSQYANINFTVEISGNRFQGNPIVSIGQGNWIIKGNEKKFQLRIVDSSLFRTYLETDMTVSSTKSNRMIFIKKVNLPTSGNAEKYNPYGNNNVFPTQANMLPTIQDIHSIEYTPRLRSSGDRSIAPYVFGVHTKPLTFIGNEHPAAPVIKGEDGKYYIFSTKDGTNVILKEVTNLNFLEPPTGSKTAKELYKRTSVAGESFFCIELSGIVIYSSGKWLINKGGNGEVMAIGKGTDFAIASPVNPNSWFSPPAWNVQINHGYAWQGSYWGWGNDVLGKGVANVRAIGELAQRPVSPGIDGFIYYSTDEAKYYKWSITKSSYSVYTPIF